MAGRVGSTEDRIDRAGKIAGQRLAARAYPGCEGESLGPADLFRRSSL